MKASHLTMSCLAGLALAACGPIGITVNINDAKVDFKTSVDAKNVMPGQAVPCTATAQNVTLVEPTATPPANVTNAGHFRYYLDDVATTPLVITAKTSIDVTIPAETKAGDHKIICRVHKHDGTPTMGTFEISITVKLKVG